MSLLRMLDIRPHDVAAMKTAKDVSGLIRLLDHRDPDIQWLAADALGSLGSPAVPPLVQVLVSRHTAVRIGAVEALGAIRDPRSVRPLVYALEHDDAVEVRWVAALALGEIGDPAAIPPLANAIRDRERYIRYGAAMSLKHLFWTPKNDSERAYHAIALQDWQGVRQLGKAAIGPLVDLLRDPDPALRSKIIELLGQTGDPGAQKACETALQDRDGTVRWTAVLAAKKCQVPTTHIPWNLSKRQRTGQNPWAAAILNFLFIGLGYNYLGYWWGFLVFMSYTSILVLAQLESGPFMPYLIAYPVTAIFAVQTFFMAKRMPDL
ncbi:HEAT repeat domain-containing protein [Methanoregula sp.]|uniref:HEAT repeat domain-containing protein n=1 Tax=Methanoregula sp. TaxID=2052170 RepID=UPI003BB18DEC